MRTSILRALLIAGLLAAVASPGTACLWDRELVAQESEFKSSYLETPAPTDSPGQVVPGSLGLIAIIVGFAMLGGALIVGLVVGLLRQNEQRRRQFNEDPQ